MENAIHCTYRAVGKDSLQNIRHTHDRLAEILFVESGDGSLVIGDKIYPLQGNSVYFIDKNTVHCSAPITENSYIRSVIGLASDFLTELFFVTGYGDVFSRLLESGGVSLDGASAERMRTLVSAISCGDRRRAVFALLSLLDLVDGEGRRVTMPDTKVSAVISYIGEHITEPLSLDAISETLFISKYYMCHLFKATTGMSITHYILLQRLALSKRLLASTDKTVSDISAETGFSDITYFSRVFRKSTGMSPSEYRKRYRE